MAVTNYWIGQYRYRQNQGLYSMQFFSTPYAVSALFSNRDKNVNLSLNSNFFMIIYFQRSVKFLLFSPLKLGHKEKANQKKPWFNLILWLYWFSQFNLVNFQSIHCYYCVSINERPNNCESVSDIPIKHTTILFLEVDSLIH